jgi:pyrroloquinoline quinone biosynthesis protein D
LPDTGSGAVIRFLALAEAFPLQSLMSNSREDPPNLNSRPRLAKRVRLQIDPVSKKAVLQNQESVILLNITGHEILVRCDGTRMLSEIIKELGLQYPNANANLAREVSEYIEHLGQKGLLEWI